MPPSKTAAAKKPPAKKKEKTAYEKRKEQGRRMSTIEFDVNIHERMHAQAAKEQRTAAGLVRIAVVEYLERAGA